MREIKFRAWDGELKEMIGPEEVLSCSFIGLNGEWLGLSDLLKGEGGFELMQYTGQYDPTATEFCEGDIIKDHTDYWEVKFFDGAFWIVAIGGNAEPELLCGNDYMEIIGNRFENPELLEAKE